MPLKRVRALPYHNIGIITRPRNISLAADNQVVSSGPGVLYQYISMP
jgi:hypothetical protein